MGEVSSNDINILSNKINELWKKKNNFSTIEYKYIEDAIYLLDKGIIRCSNYINDKWIVNEWVKKAILLYFTVKDNIEIESGCFKYYDKIPVKNSFNNTRVVPNAVARYGAYISEGVILMPSYVNIGAYVDTGVLVDTWATVGSCAQIGKNVHLSGGVGIGGVLEPIYSSPVIIEDNCFIGSRSIIVEGVVVKKEAVIAANVVITSSTKIIDVTGDYPIYYNSFIPERSVVIPGSYPRKYKCGVYNIPCALIIGQRKQSTDKKTSLNEVLRDFKVSL